MSMKTDVLSHIEQQIDELRHIYENIKAEHFPFGAITDTSPSPSPTTNYSDDQFVKVKGILDDLKIQFKTLLFKKGKTLSMPTVSKPELFHRTFSTSPGKKSQTISAGDIEPLGPNYSNSSLVLHGSMWSWKTVHESSWICSIVSYNLVTHEDAHYEFEIKTEMSEGLFASLLPGRSYSDIRVSRRYKEFEALYDTLQRVYPYLFVPTLPPKKPKKLRVELTVKRKSRFELWLSYLASHPIFCRAPCVLNFLLSEEEWRRPSKERYSVVPIENVVTFPPYTGVSSINLNMLHQLVKTIVGLSDHFKMEQNCLCEDFADVYSHYAEDLTTFARLEKDLGFVIVYSFCDLFKEWAATFSRRKWLYENQTRYFAEIIVNLKEFFTMLEELRSRLIGNFKSPLERIVMEAELNWVVEHCTRRLILQVAKFIESHRKMLVYDSKNCLDALSSVQAHFEGLKFEF
ncbi:unnamed protein product [Hymenolepis diminuta]|uniref:PX domain-containing protein n=1 Tax=Hymenolepis diminuta TaxID=6216 RepID=A0A564YYU2_HYMDI|nr:unnamed protein product [Hymenolepis diminuta]